MTYFATLTLGDTLAAAHFRLLAILGPNTLAADDTLSVFELRPEGLDVGLVDVVDDDGGHSDDLGRASRHDSHKDKEEHGVLSGGSKELLGNQGSGQTLRKL